jgi:hypothetical protein
MGLPHLGFLVVDINQKEEFFVPINAYRSSGAGS